MKTLYIECKMGAAGDMLMGALYELLPDGDTFLNIMNHLYDGVSVSAERKMTCGIAGTHITVSVNGMIEEASEDFLCGVIPAHGNFHVAEQESTHEHRHSHTTPGTIRNIIDHFPLPQEVRDNAKAVYDRIARAEAKAHGTEINHIHFHEVGSLDAIVDITGVCLAMHILHPDNVIVSPIHLGSGQIRCAHGIVAVPAPATANLLIGVPCYSGEITGELCTPTGAALLTYFADTYGVMPSLMIDKIGYGVGKKEFPAANCVRMFYGESNDPQQAEIVELRCNIDDMTAEALAFASEQLLSAGALDVSVSPLYMKKGRVGSLFTVLCKPQDESRLTHAILRETTTNGVRSCRCGKYILRPSIRTIDTSYGTIRIKCAQNGDVYHEKPEYADVAAAAKSANLPFQKVWLDIVSEMLNSKPPEN